MSETLHSGVESATSVAPPETSLTPEHREVAATELAPSWPEQGSPEQDCAPRDTVVEEQETKPLVDVGAIELGLEPDQGAEDASKAEPEPDLPSRPPAEVLSIANFRPGDSSPLDAGAIAEPTPHANPEPESQPTPRVETSPPIPQPVAVETAPEESFADIFSEFQRSHIRREAGASQIRGTVVALTSDSVLVDIGFKSEGILPLTAFASAKEPPKAGDSLQVSVKGRDEDGYYQLSLFKTAVPKDWSSLERAFEEKATIVGTVTAVVKGGLHVDCGIRAFLPASRSGARDATEMEKLIGQEIRVRITKLDIADEDLVVDRRVVTEEEALEGKARRYAEVQEGAVLDGTVRSLTEYGAFVDLGGVDGLLHIGDLAWTRVANVSDVLSIGQQIEVKVLKIDPETHRIALGIKQLQPHPWDKVAETYSLGQRIRGVVTRIAEFGAFVELEPGIEGLVHLSEMSWSKRIYKATEVVQVGDAIDAVILAIALPERRISLGLKQALGDPWVNAAATLSPGSVVEGPVSSILKFGAFVQVAEGVEGMVHISEIVPDRRLNHPSDVLRVGQIVKALVLEIDKDKRQLRLSIKQLIPTSLDEFLAEHQAGDTVTGRIVSIVGNAAQVELGEGIVCPATLPVAKVETPAPEAPATEKVDLSAFSSMLKQKWKTGSSTLSKQPQAKGIEPPLVGQVRRFRIAQMDAEAKRIGLELLE